MNQQASSNRGVAAGGMVPKGPLTTAPAAPAARAEAGTQGGGRTLPALAVLNTDEDLAAVVQKFMLEQRFEGGTTEILEAGCGNRWYVDLGTLNYRLTGVDLDAEAVRIRKEKWKDLHEAIIGDLREVNLGGRQFDIVYNAYVLEHIDGAEGVLQRFVDWLKPGGIIVLKMPDANSFYGLLTRLTPHWFHVLYYRHVQGLATAGQPGYAPYPTYYDAVVSRAGICAFARRAGLTIEAEYGLAHRLGNRLADLVFRICGRVVNGLTLSRYAHKHVNLLYVLRKRA